MRALLALLLLAALPAAILGWKELDNAQDDMKITAEAARQGRVSMGGGLVSASCRRLREVPAPALMSRAFYCSDLASFAHIPPLSVFAPRRGCLRRKSRRRRRSGAPPPPPRQPPPPAQATPSTETQQATPTAQATALTNSQQAAPTAQATAPTDSQQAGALCARHRGHEKRHDSAGELHPGL